MGSASGYSKIGGVALTRNGEPEISGGIVGGTIYWFVEWTEIGFTGVTTWNYDPPALPYGGYDFRSYFDPYYAGVAAIAGFLKFDDGVLGINVATNLNGQGCGFITRN